MFWIGGRLWKVVAHGSLTVNSFTVLQDYLVGNRELQKSVYFPFKLPEMVTISTIAR